MEGCVNLNSSFSEVSIKRLEGMRVASYCIISKNPEEEVIAYVNSWLAKNSLDKQSIIRNFGFDVPVSKEQSAEGLRGYEYWVTIPNTVGTAAAAAETVSESDGICIKNIEADEYAVLRITDPFSNPFDLIPNGWKSLQNWVMSSEYKTTQFSNRYWLEEVIQDGTNTYMDIYFPVKDGGKKLNAQLIDFKVIKLENCKMVGKEIKCIMGHPDGNPIPAFWGKCFEDGSMNILETHPDRLYCNASIGWMGNFNMDDGSFSYVVGVFVKPDAVVPTDMIGIDMPEAKFAVGTIKGMEPDLFMNAHDFTETEIENAGLKIDCKNYVEFEWYDERFCLPQGDKMIDLYIKIL
jgi:predicted transcriptional regulator YdeE